MLLVADGVALAGAKYYYCQPNENCYCPDEPGWVCVGTEDRDFIYGTNGAFGDKIFGKGGADNIIAYGGGDYVDGGPGDDYIGGEGDINATPGHNTLIGGDGNDTLEGGGGYDECYGGPGDDAFYDSCDKQVQ